MANTKQFKTGEQATYVDLFHVIVLSQHEDGTVSIAMSGRGYIAGIPIIQRVEAKWLEHGWNEIQPICKHD